MHATNQPYSSFNLLSGLVKDYLDRHESLKPYIFDFPDKEGFQRAILRRAAFPFHRELLAETLKKQNENLPNAALVLDQIDRLRHAKTFTVTTGHQICLATGPLFFVYKIISTIRLAEQLKDWFPEYHFVPVYWMATEDHDFEEVNHVFVKGQKLQWNSLQRGAVGRFETRAVEEVWEKWQELSPDADEFLQQLKSFYHATTFAEATRKLVHHLFGEYGLVTLDADHRELKRLFVPAMRNELHQQWAEDEVNRASRALSEAGYINQIAPRKINLFYLHDQLRERIEITEDGVWKVNHTEQIFDNAALEQELQSFPERFSPNVVMRPLYQETILPNLAYIGGPGEVNYWLQLKSCFNRFGVFFPMLMLRNNALLLPQRTQQRMAKLSFSLRDLFGPKEKLTNAIIGDQAQNLLQEQIEETERLFEEVETVLGRIDSSLVNAAKAELQRTLNGIAQLEKKAIKAIKQKEEVKLQQLERLLADIKPNGATQDRTENIFEYLPVFGKNLLDELKEAFDPFDNQYTIITE